ncbi:MAG: uracil-DNA glycosylase [Polyangiales bacterium]
MSERQAELAALRVAARAYVEWEAELSGQGIPAFTGAPVAREAAPAPFVPEPPAAEPPAPVMAEAPPPSPALVVPNAPQPVVPAPPAASPMPAPAPMAAADKHARLAQLADEARGCTRCALAKGRTQTVFSRGSADASLMFIGEGPGFEEDKSGLPFVGPAGQLLDKMIAAMGFGRDDVYVCNVVKCRPPGNRTPLPEEGRACAPFLEGQLEAVRPRLIVALGRCASENLGLAAPGAGGWRGRWGRFRGVEVMPTYHPAFLLRSPQFKRDVWNDLQKVMQRLKEGP